MVERSFPHALAWFLFTASLFIGAGLLLSPDPAMQSWGLALLATPVLGLGLVLMLYYWRSRRAAA